MIINRSLAPDLVPLREPKFPAVEIVQLANGIPVYLLNAGTQEVSRIEFCYQAGSIYQIKSLQAGLANAMLTEGTTNYSANAISEIFDFYGAYLQPSVDQHIGQLSAVSLSKNWSYLLPVIKDILQHSNFSDSAFQVIFDQKRKRFLLENQKVKIQCLKKFSQVLFGNDHPYAQNVTLEDYSAISVVDLRRFAEDRYFKAKPELFVSGCFNDDLIDLLNQQIGTIEYADSGISSYTIPNVEESASHYVRVDYPGSMQSAIRIGRLLVGKKHPDYYPLQILITVLGGYFGSRLMQNIREDKGYTYGIGAGFFSLIHEGYLVISTEVNTEFEQATIDEVFAELKRLQETLVPTEELNRVVEYLKGELLRDLDGPFALAQAYHDIHNFGLTTDRFGEYWKALTTINAKTLQEVACKYLNPEDLYTVVVGGDQSSE